MRYNRTKSESRINTGVSLISSKMSEGKSLRLSTENQTRKRGGWPNGILQYADTI